LPLPSLYEKKGKKVHMLGFPKEQHLRNLIDEAIVQVSTLGESIEADIVLVLEKTRQVLASPAESKRNLPLILSAARWRVRDVEKYAVRRIVHDDNVDGHSMSILVRVRLICAEVIRILDAALNDLRVSRQRIPS